MHFRKYQSVKRPHGLRWNDLESFLSGHLVVMPKLDGANASVWLKEDGSLGYGSRNQELDGSNFRGLGECVKKYESELKTLLTLAGKDCTIYGEWLVPHTVKGYKEDMWNKFWIFDIAFEDELERMIYLPYSRYSKMCVEASYPFYIVPVKEFPSGATQDELIEVGNTCDWGMQEGLTGEGVVVKNYAYAGHPWVKFISEKFGGQKAVKTKKIWDGNSIEERIVSEFLDVSLVEKEYQKIMTINPEMHIGALIPQLLGRVWFSFIEDNIWTILKKHKNPTLNFANLRKCVEKVTKEFKKELFK